jgi:hypothetical protein
MTAGAFSQVVAGLAAMRMALIRPHSQRAAWAALCEAAAGDDTLGDAASRDAARRDAAVEISELDGGGGSSEGGELSGGLCGTPSLADTFASFATTPNPEVRRALSALVATVPLVVRSLGPPPAGLAAALDASRVEAPWVPPHRASGWHGAEEAAPRFFAERPARHECE